MEKLIITRHEVIKNFIVQLINSPTMISVKRSASIEDVRDKEVYSDHSLPKEFIDAAGAVHILKTKVWIDYKSATEIDLLIAVPYLVEVKTKKVEWTPKKVKKRIIGESKTARDVLNQLKKAKENMCSLHKN